TDDSGVPPSVTHSDVTTPGSCPQSYAIARTWRATDGCGNSATCLQTIHVEDSIPPVITCPSDRTFECSQPIDFGQATASDNCDTQLTITFSDEIVPGSNPESYQIRLIWRAVDDCQNSAECTQIVTIIDRTPPAITCPSDRTFQCGQPIDFGEATATDNCDTQVTITSSDQTILGTSLQDYQIHRTWVARDASGNSSTCVQVVSVVDTVPPVLTVAPDLVLPCKALVEFTEPQIRDNCDPNPVISDVTTTVLPGSGPCEYIHVRCWTAVDATRNVSSQVCQRITRVEDTTPPVLICGDPKTIQAGEPLIFNEPAYDDSCPAAGSLQSGPPVVGGVTADGDTVYTKTWTALDACDNLTECYQNITVQSGPAPAESCSFICWDWADDCLEGPNRSISTTPTCVRDDHFSEVFPNGLMVGTSTRYHVVWTSAAAVENFKCGYGLPAALKRNYTDPQRGALGSIYGEILALRLNREFSCGGYFHDFAGPGGIACFGSVVVPPEVPRFSGLFVDQLLAIADAALSGDKTALLPYGNSLLRLQAATAYMNWLFGDCGGHGRRPEHPPFLASGTMDRFGDGQLPEGASQPLPEKFSMTAQPNPLRSSVVISLALPVDGNVAIEIYDIQGRKVVTVLRERVAAGYRNVAWNGTDDLGAPVVSGVYFCRVQIEGQLAAMQKLMKL
ncbi:MAG: T9SS type A sorting domain-containing protein, partial [Candidatus Eisenbacteria bacterium]